MDRSTERALISECVTLAEQKLTQLSDNNYTVSTERYLDEDIFRRELDRIFKTRPLAAAQTSELLQPGSYIAKEWIDNLPLLLVRGEDNSVRAFLNICSHRGMRLVENGAGRRTRFSCPYHGWTYTAQGELTGGPQFDLGFPQFQRQELGLTELSCREVGGVIFVLSDPQAQISPDFLPTEMHEEMRWLNLRELRPFQTTTKVWKMNWKTMIEGGAEAYHFNVAHKDSLAPFFLGNTSISQSWGDCSRTVLPKKSMMASREMPEEQWNIREMSNLLYSFFPNLSLLVQPDHIAWLNTLPLSPGEIRIEQTTLAPPPADGSDIWSQQESALYRHNHELTHHILQEDFAIGETIHQNLESALVRQIRFGRFESALIDFHQKWEAIMT